MIATIRSIIALKVFDWALSIAPAEDKTSLAIAFNAYLRDYQKRYRLKLAQE